ncbi:MAG: 3-methyl-2-oxobutanoate hydroxymethyltransferase [Chloroflexi bacterium]|nr:3-methyl-2-oxobutanoate hydroxymethyltransferase [Chloroflexota bacterium]
MNRRSKHLVGDQHSVSKVGHELPAKVLKGVKMPDKVTIASLHEMKRQHQKIVAAVVYETQMAKIMDRAGADVLSVGDSLGRAFLGHENEDDFTVDEMIPFCRAVC